MKVHLIKFLLSALIMSGVGISSLFAQSVSADSTKLLAAVSKKEVEYKSEIKEANIIFPESLEDCKEQSLSYIEKFSDKKRDFLLHTYETGKEYFPKVIAILKQYQLPEELKVLIALESGFSGNAVSRSGAVGYWQIMAPIAREYGLHITSGKETTLRTSRKKDERKNFNKSTVFAAKYFRNQSLSLNSDLLLMVASYNCGLGTICRAVKRCHKPDPSFWDIKNYLPKETRNYVMNFIALNVIFNNYENFANNTLQFTPKVVSVPLQNTEINNSIAVEPAVVE